MRVVRCLHIAVTRAIRQCRWAIMRSAYRLMGLDYYFTVSQSIGPMARMLRSAQTSIIVVSGELNPAVWNSPPVRGALLEVTGRPMPPTIEIIFGPLHFADPSAFGFLTSLGRQGKLRLYCVDEREKGHFVCVDGRLVKVEDPHEPLADERSGYVGSGVGGLAETLEGRFKEIKAYAKPLPP